MPLQGWTRFLWLSTFLRHGARAPETGSRLGTDLTGHHALHAVEKVVTDPSQGGALCRGRACSDAGGLRVERRCAHESVSSDNTMHSRECVGSLSSNYANMAAVGALADLYDVNAALERVVGSQTCSEGAKRRSRNLFDPCRAPNLGPQAASAGACLRPPHPSPNKESGARRAGACSTPGDLTAVGRLRAALPDRVGVQCALAVHRWKGDSGSLS